MHKWTKDSVFVWFRINRKDHAFSLIMKLKWTKRRKEHYFMKLLRRSPNAHFSYALGHNHLLKSKTGLFLSITAIRNLDINFDFKVVAQGLQKTNMQSIQRLLYFLNARTICTIFLHNWTKARLPAAARDRRKSSLNWTQCIDSFSL